MNIIEYIPLLTILCYIPFVCISDLRTRRFNFLYFGPLIVINLPTLYFYLEGSPDRNYWLLTLTLGLCVIMLILATVRAIGGADFWFASFIMIFVQYNPLEFPRTFFALDFFWTLLLVTVCIPIPVYFYNKLHRNDLFDEVTDTRGYGVIEMFTKYPRGIPFMIPISLAFYLTLLLEWIV